MRRVVLLIAGLAAAGMIVEAGLDLIAATPLWRVLPVAAVAPYGPDPDTGYRHRPQVAGVWVTEHRARVATSSLGLRDRERNPARSPAPRAVVLGNSLIEALQVDLTQTAVAVGERLLQRRWPGAELVNLGLAGATPPVDVARLRSVGLALQPDIAVVVFASDELQAAVVRPDERAPGYAIGEDGEAALSHRFRDSAGYRFRMSAARRAVYWLIDHSAVARLLNNRRSVGFFAEWPGQRPETPPATPYANGACDDPALDRAAALWIDGLPASDRAVRDAFLRDLGDTARRHNLRIVCAPRGIPATCAGRDRQRAALMAAIEARVGAAGLLFADFDRRVADAAGVANVPGLYGFGPQRGIGHLNVEGNLVWGSVLADIVAETLGAGPTR